MRVLALDYGSARCGCAVSDPSGTIVTPIAPVPRPSSRRGLDALRRLVREREVAHVVVGLPLSLRGHDTPQTTETRAFAERLSRILDAEVVVEMHDERFTTRLARRTGGNSTASEDSRAAAHLLEGWLTAQAR
jgi:putative holliday junction resolvase